MPRRARVTKRELVPDAKYQNLTIARFVSKVLSRGKKSVAEQILYDALREVEEKTKQNPIEVLELAIKNATPLLQVKPRRVGGATYQVPVEVPIERGVSLAIRWIIQSARAQKGKPMYQRLATELMEASQNQGTTIKKREDMHKMAEANRAFVHYRW